MKEQYRVSAIAAMDEKRGIGKGNDLLFRIPRDFERMRNLTTGHPIIMGRKTHESIGRVLPGRTNVIITSDLDYGVQGAVVVHSLEEAFRVAKESPGSDEIFIFGGARVFADALPQTDKLYLTIVKGEFNADTFYPDYSKEFTKVVYREKFSENGYKYEFIDLER